MKDKLSPSDDEYHRWLRDNAENRCFEQFVPRSNALQDAARFATQQRSFAAKYPGESFLAIKALAKEVLGRLEAAKARDSDPKARPAAAQ